MDVDFASMWASVVGVLVDLLPRSPTIDSDAMAALAQYAGYINYFFPVGDFLRFSSALLVAAGVYYAVMVILRLVKVIR